MRRAQPKERKVFHGGNSGGLGKKKFVPVGKTPRKKIGRLEKKRGGVGGGGGGGGRGVGGVWWAGGGGGGGGVG